MAKETGLENHRFEHLQVFWGVVNLKHIYYASLVWDDFIQQSKSFKNKSKYKVHFFRYTKLLISHFMENHPDIDRRAEEKQHSPDHDHILSGVRIQATNTDKIRRKIPDFLISPVVKETTAYKTYEATEKAGVVGKIEKESKSVVTRKTAGRGREGKKASDTGSTTRQPRKKKEHPWKLYDEELRKSNKRFPLQKN